MKLEWNNTLFPSLHVINGKPYPNGRKGVLRNHNYRSDPKLGPVIVEIRRIPCSFHDCTTKLSLPWDYTIKEACNHPRYGRV